MKKFNKLGFVALALSGITAFSCGYKGLNAVITHADDTDDEPEYVEEGEIDERYEDYVDNIFGGDSLVDIISDDDTASVQFSGYSSFGYGSEQPALYECEFNAIDMTFSLTVTPYDTENYPCEGFEADAIVNGFGNLDFQFAIETEDGQEEWHYLSEYREPSDWCDLYDECDVMETELIRNQLMSARQVELNSFNRSIISRLKKLKKLVVAVVVVIIVAETAEQIRARQNHDYNIALESNYYGSSANSYIYQQDYFATQGHDYRFGFTTLANVGCEVISVYNMHVKRQNDVVLSQVIYDFETWGLEYSFGFGFLGSSSKQIYRYLDKKHINYKKFSRLSSMSNKMDEVDNAYGIYSAHNIQSISFHTYFIEKNNNNGYFTYYAYNKEHFENPSIYDSFSGFGENQGSFICGYIIY